MKNKRMFVVSYEFLFNDKLSDVEKLSYIHLYSYKEKNTNISYPSQITMNLETGIGSKTTINKCLKRLEELNFIKKHKSKNPNENNRYELLFDMFKGTKNKENYCYIPFDVFTLPLSKELKMFYIKYHALLYTYKNNSEYNTFLEYLSSKLSLKLETILLNTYMCTQYGLLNDFQLPGLTCDENNETKVETKVETKKNKQQEPNKINDELKINDIDLDIEYDEPVYTDIYDLKDKINNIRKFPKAVGYDFSDI